VQIGVVSPAREVPSHISRPAHAITGIPPVAPARIVLHNERSLERMRKACGLAAKAREVAGAAVAPGVTGDAIDKAVHEFIVSHDAYPSPLNYHGFPKSCCTSVNEVVCHGIPDSRPLREGDIVNVDVSCFVDGVHGDCSATFLVGRVSEEARTLVRVAREALDKAIAICGDGVALSAIGAAIEDHIAPFGFSSVREYGGHGIGAIFHMLPFVLHYRNPSRDLMRPGMVFTIEPMINEGSAQTRVLPDKWTVVTADSSLSAQFEETVAIGLDGKVEVLTSTHNYARFFGNARPSAP
jgi:methionyl aminopeptidase